MTKHDALRMTYVGGPTAVIELGGLRLLTDPAFDVAGSEYATGPVTLWKTAGPALDAASVGAVDVVLLSHDHHFDNLDHTGRELLSKAARVLTTREGAERLGGHAAGLTPWESVELTAPDGRVLRVTATPAQHGPKNGDRGPVIGFVLQFTDDRENAVYVSGDTVWFEGVEEVIRRFPSIKTAVLFLGAAHVAIVPSHLTFTAEEGVKVARALPEAKIVPLHFEGWKHFTESRDVIARTFAEAGLGDRLQWLEAGRAVAV
ncbi:MAG TPA: MBL fold metallo-hydrolase [Alloacidobacterium sp.]|nr:MBL fold metallo-hydrolase [Alloacidobacterium sp.]